MISSVYNYYLATYGSQMVGRNDTHKKSELRDVYNSMVKSSRKTPLYKIENTERVQKYAIDLKETARAMKNVASTLSDTEGSIAGFTKKKADSSNKRVAEATYIGNNDGESGQGNGTEKVPELSIYVRNLASPQVNTGNYLNPDHMELEAGTYSFDLSVGEYAYEFQFNIGGGDTNKSIQEKLARLINRSNIGASAEVVTDKSGFTALQIKSDATGNVGYRDLIFNVSHDSNSDAQDAVQYFGIDKVSSKPENAHFTINGLERNTVSNTFTVEGEYEITLKGSSVTENDVAKIGLKPDIDTIMENVSELIGAYNSMVDLAIEKDDGSYDSGKLFRDVSGMAKLHKNELDSAGFMVQEDGHINIEESLLIQSANDGTLADCLHKLNSFKNVMIKRADNISVNPMIYVYKKLIAYPHPTRNFVNPYVTSRYSGMMFSVAV